MAITIDVDLHIDKNEKEFRADVSENIYGNVVIHITDNLMIFCTPEQALKIGKTIIADTKRLLKERAESEMAEKITNARSVDTTVDEAESPF